MGEWINNNIKTIYSGHEGTLSLINKDGIHQLIIVLGKISISYLSTTDKYMKKSQISFDNLIFLWRGNLHVM